MIARSKTRRGIILLAKLQKQKERFDEVLDRAAKGEPTFAVQESKDGEVVGLVLVGPCTLVAEVHDSELGTAKQTADWLARRLNEPSPKRIWAVWEEEYPEEGSMLVEAATAEEAKAQYPPGDDPKNPAPLRAEPMTLEALQKRIAADPA